MSTPTIILASAGSGKTFQLTSRYLRLIAEGAEPSTIVATTFTRAAAAEIRDRILERAARAVDDDSARRELEKALEMEPGTLDPEALLDRLVAGWHRLQIRTIDSFMSAIVATHALELGAPSAGGAGATMADEVVERQLARDAAASMLSTMDPEVAVELLRQLTAGRSDADIGRAIGSIVVGLHRVWREAPPEAWERIVVPRAVPQERYVDAIESLRRIAARDPGGRFGTACAKAVDHAEHRAWAELLKGALVRNSVTTEPTFYKKPIPPDALAALQTIHANAAHVVVDGIRRQTLAARSVIGHYASALAALKHERGIITFDDLPHLLARAEAFGGVAQAGHRLDTTVHHLLLDEMQDTSAVQWRALEPFAEPLWTTDDTDHSFFCVGDLKQSIYGWRGASPEILATLPDRLDVDPVAIQKTRRCGPAVVEAVNILFGNLVGAEILEGPGALAAEQFCGYFAEHETTSTAASFVELRAIAAAGADGGDDAPKVIRGIDAAPAIIAELHRAAPMARIGVLVRTNASVNQLLAALGPAGLGLDVSGRGGMPLIDAPPVEAILDALRLSIHPGDSVAAFNVAASPLGAVIGLARSEATSSSARGRVAETLRRRVLRVGVAETIRAWTGELASAVDGRERRRLVQLVELAASAESTGPLELESFIEAVTRTPVADESSATVQVMTIHQSKGLEFDFVVLPELDFEFARSAGDVAAVDRSEEGGAPRTIVRWVDESLRAVLPPAIQGIFERQKQRAAVESLSLLYVAMTRAKRGLVMLVEPPRKGRRKVSWAALLRGALANGRDGCDEVLVRFGDRDAALESLATEARVLEGTAGSASVRARGIGGPETEYGTSPTSVIVDGAAVGAGSSGGALSRAAVVRAPSGAASEGGHSVASLLAMDPARRRDAADRGTALHTCFAAVEWTETFATGDDDLCRVVQRDLPDRDAAWCAERVGEFRVLLDRGDVAAALRRPASEGGVWSVLREAPFLRLVDGAVQRGTIDRLLLHRVGSRVIAARIIDFKTGPATPERYAPQLAAYAAAVHEQWRVDLPAIAREIVALDAVGIGTGPNCDRHTP